MGIAADPPTQHCKLKEWWLRKHIKFLVKTRKNLDALIILGCWSLWKNHNAWVFNNQSQQFSVMELVTRIRDEFSAWMLGMRGVIGVLTLFETIACISLYVLLWIAQRVMFASLAESYKSIYLL
jgi:hypothetical protein